MSTPPTALRSTIPEIKIAGLPLAGILSAIPDFGLAYVMVAAIAGWGIARGQDLDWPHALMMTEFLTMHAGGFFALVMTTEAMRWQRALLAFGLGAVYLAFAAGYSWLFHSWYPFLMVGGLGLNRLLFVLLRNPGSMTALEKHEITTAWRFTGSSYILSFFAGFGLAGGLRMHGADFLLYAGALHFTACGIYELFFARELGRPAYETNSAAHPANGEVWGINVNLWHLVWRRVLGYGFTLGGLTVFGIFVPIIMWFFMAIFALLFVFMLYQCVRWLRYCSMLMRRPPQRLRLRVLTAEDESLSVTSVSLYRPGEEQPLVASLEVEPLRRRRFLAPGQYEVDADVFSDFRENTPTIIRVGRAHLCSHIPTMMEPGC